MDDPENLDLPCVVEIRRNADGEVRRDTTFRYHGSFVWADGNFACDCNRGDFFDAAGGDPDSSHVCSDNLYSVRVLGEDGKVLYEDDDWSSK